jgi:hypothetical protein
LAQIAQAVVLTGNVVVVGLDGLTRPLQQGDSIEKGETVRTLAGASVELLLEDGQILSLSAGQETRLDDSLAQTEATPTAQESAVQLQTPQDVLQALEQGGNLDVVMAAPAAGAGSGGGGDGSSFVRLLRIVEGVEPLSYEYSIGGLPQIEDVRLESLTPGEDDSPPTLMLALTGPLLVVEGEVSSSYSVTLSGEGLAAGQSVTFTIDSVSGSATEGEDFAALLAGDLKAGAGITLSGVSTGADDVITLIVTNTGGSTLAAGSALLTFEIRTTQDTEVEGLEDFKLELGSTSANVQVLMPTVTTEIVDNDVLTVNLTGDAQVMEGGTAGYVVSLSGGTLANDQTVSVQVATGPGQRVEVPDATPGAGFDYNPLTQTLTFQAGGPTAVNVEVVTLDDSLLEGVEEYTVNLSNEQGATVGTRSVTTEIVDGDSLTVSISGAATVNEGETAGYVVSLSGGTLANDQTVSVQVATGPGQRVEVPDATPGAGFDYNPLTQTLTFQAGGPTAVNVEVVTLDDSLLEGVEEYTVNLSNEQGATVGTRSVTTEIVDGDSLTVSISGAATVNEGETAGYVVSLSGGTLANDQTVSVQVATGPGQRVEVPDATPGAGFDYNPLTQTLTFQAGGPTAVNVEVVTLDDSLLEGVEEYTVNLSNEQGATVGTRSVTTEIVDGDSLTVSISGAATVNEGETAGYVVSLSGGTLANDQTVSVQVATGPGQRVEVPDATPGAGFDYNPLTQTLTFQAGGPTAVNVEVVTLDDSLLEGVEEYTVNLSNEQGATVGTRSVTTEIVDGDSLTVSISGAATVNEGETAGYVVSLSGGTLANDQTVSVQVATGPGQRVEVPDATPGAGFDYNPLTQTLTFQAGGPTAVNVEVVTLDDSLLEGVEEYTVNLSNEQGATVGTRSVTTEIVDGDSLTVSISGAATVNEGETAGYVVSLSGGTLANDQTVSVQVATGPGQRVEVPDATPGAGFDYNPLTQTLTFQAGGPTAVNVEVVTLDDSLLEGVEEYTVNLSNEQGATVGTRSVTTEIVDGDSLTVSISGAATVNEGETAGYVVSLSGGTLANDQTVSVQVATGPGQRVEVPDATPGAGFDYNPLTQTLTFQAGGPTAVNVEVVTLDDSLLEGVEEYTVNLSNEQGATVGTRSVTTEIVVDGDSLTVSISGAATVNEGETAGYVVSLSGGTLANDQTVSVQVATGPGQRVEVPDATPGAGFDYNPLTQTLTFQAGGPTAVNVEVVTLDDSLLEGVEEYTVNLSNEQGATVGTRSVTTEIVDGDSLTVSISGAATVNEGETAGYVVSLSGGTLANDQTVSVQVATGPGQRVEVPDATPGAGFDYNPLTQTLTFQAGGPTAVNVEVVTLDDSLLEGVEEYTVNLSNEQGATVGTRSVTTEIVDGDSLTVSISGAATVNEGETAGYVVSLSGGTLANDQTVSVQVATGPGQRVEVPDATPGAGFDYNPLTQTLTFQAGGPTAVNVEVVTLDDSLLEGVEEYTVNLSNEQGATVGTRSVTTEIVDGDSLTVSISGAATVNEGETAGYVVSLSGGTLANDQTVSVQVATGPGQRVEVPDATPGAGFDYNPLTQTLTFQAGGPTAVNVEVVTLDDSLLEGVEEYTVNLSNEQGATVGTRSVTTEIVDGDSLTVSISGAATVNEGETAGYVVSLSGGTLANDQTVSVQVATGPGQRVEVPDATPGAGFDYNPLTQTLTFQAGGPTAVNVEVVTLDDSLLEGVEEYTVNLSNEQGATVGTRSVTTEIVDNDTALLPSSLTLSEEGLSPDGRPDTLFAPGHADTTNDATRSGTINYESHDSNDPLPVRLLTSGLPTKLGNSQLDWSYPNAVDYTVIEAQEPGTGAPIIRITLNGGSPEVSNPGTSGTIGYQVELLRPIAHLVQGEDDLSFDFQVEVGSSTSPAGSTTVQVTIEDDAPEARPDLDSVSSDTDITSKSLRIATGNLVTGKDLPSGADANSTDGVADFFGADGPAAGAAVQLPIQINNIAVTEGENAQFTVKLVGVVAGSQLTLNLYDDLSDPQSATYRDDFYRGTFQYRYSTEDETMWRDVPLGVDEYGTPFTVAAGDSTLLIRVDTFDDGPGDSGETFTLTGTLASEALYYRATAQATIVEASDPVPPPSDSNIEVFGQYGKLDLSADGSYRYTLYGTELYDPEPQLRALMRDVYEKQLKPLDEGESVTDLFPYTIQDADGDTSATTLAVTVNGVNYPTQASYQTSLVRGKVDEAGLQTGSLPSLASRTDSGTITMTVTDPNGLDDIQSVQFRTAGKPGGSFTLAELGTIATPGAVLAFETQNGTVTLTSYEMSSVANRMTIKIGFSFELTSPTNDVDGSAVAETNEFDVQVRDEKAGTTWSMPVKIEIVDDLPSVVVGVSGRPQPVNLTVPGQTETMPLSSLFVIREYAYGADRPDPLPEPPRPDLAFQGLPPTGLETNLSTLGGQAISLYSDTSTRVVGRAGAADVFTLEIVGDQLQTTMHQYVTAPGNDSAVWLQTKSGELVLTGSVMITDADGDTAPSFRPVTLASPVKDDVTFAFVNHGTAGDDTRIGGAGDDLLIGGPGSDTLTGGVGADVFKWQLDDTGIDTITDFNLSGGSFDLAEGDKLDLRDLLTDEGDAPSNLELADFLHFTQNDSNLELRIDPNGMTDNVFSATQTIVLQGVNLGPGLSDQQIIEQLRNNLKVGGDL